MSNLPVLDAIDFKNKFYDEGVCREHLFRLRWPRGFQCPKCGHHEFYLIKHRNLYQCKGCNRQTSITAGTVMHKTRVSLTSWFWAIFMVVSQSTHSLSVESLRREIGVSYPTAWAMYKKIRSVMQEKDAETKLGGIIQLDDAFFGSSRDGRRPREERTPAHVAVSLDDEGRPLCVRAQVIDKVTLSSARSFLKAKVPSATTVVTDRNVLYRGLTKDGYDHRRTLSMSKGCIHSVISQMKTFMLRICSGHSKEHIQLHLDEFSYRFNRRFEETPLFDTFLSAFITQ